MNFQEAVAKYSAVPPAAVLDELLGWLKDGRGFCHVRINDGEFLCMFRKRRPEQVNGCMHHYFPDLGDALLRLLREAKDTTDNCRLMVPDHPCQESMRFRIGSYWFMQSDRRRELDEGAAACVDHLDQNQMFDLPWVGTDDLVKGLPKTIELFDFIREDRQSASGFGRPVVLVGHKGIAEAQYCLGANFLEIPRYDCWLSTDRILSLARPYAEHGAVFVWSCGMSKTWLWDTWQEFPQSSHLDAGHLWDGVFGDLSRAWLRRQDPNEPLFATYKGTFYPWVRKFIP